MKTEMRNSISGLLLIPLVFACFALLPSVQAAPDPATPPGLGNVADGNGALGHVTAGASFNSAFGTNALNTLTTGNNNAAQGNSALFTTNGNKNTAVGVLALRLNASGDDNTAIGYRAFNVGTGSGNTAVGSLAGVNLLAGTNNTFVGASAGINYPIGGTGTVNNVICIGEDGDGTANTGGRCFIGNIRGVTLGNGGGLTVLVDSDGQLGTSNSSRRFKKDINAINQASEAILALKPVTYHYKGVDTKKAAEEPQFGLIAEDVAEVNPDLVAYGDDGQPLSVRYDAVNVMLLNEFLKEHKKVEELQATVAQQKKDMKVFAAKLKEQASQIQKVSARLEVNKPAPRTVANK